jgi:hypothetical protein
MRRMRLRRWLLPSAIALCVPLVGHGGGEPNPKETVALIRARSGSSGATYFALNGQSLGGRLSGTDLYRKTRAEVQLLNPSTNPTNERIQFIKLQAAISQ